MRALAHIEKILAIDPIANADAIEAAQVLGWSVVVKKGDFKVGDLVVFYEIDSFLNGADTRYESFKDRFINWDGKTGMRLKTIKLRGQISQGLVLGLSQFPEIKNPKEGDDVTEILKIEKWESLAERESNAGGPGGRALGAGRTFPAFIQKTDQNRVQSYLAQLPRHMEDDDFEVTIKLDGSSMTVYAVPKGSKYYDMALEMKQKKVKGFKKILQKVKRWLGIEKTPEVVTAFCSRNLQLDDKDTSHFGNYVTQNAVQERLASLGRALAIQGELIGPSIQQNYEKVKDFEYHVFDVFDIEKQEYLLPQDSRNVVTGLGLNYVPVLEKHKKLTDFGSVEDMRAVCDAILADAEGPGMYPGVKREGKVYKSTKTGLSFKAISNSYLLAKEKKQKD